MRETTAVERIMHTLIVCMALCGIAGAVSMTDTAQVRQIAGDPTVLKVTDRGILAQNCPPYQVDEATAGTVYIRYSSSTGNIHIFRSVTADSVTTYTRAYDAWADRATATYSPINQ